MSWRGGLSVKPRRRVILIVLGLLAVAAAVTAAFVWLGAPGQPKSDSEQIEDLAARAANAYNDGDWRELAALTWPPGSREGLSKELDGKFPLRFKLDGSLSLKNLTIAGDRASCDATISWHIGSPTNRFSETFRATFIKSGGLWYVEPTATRASLGR
jgi:hypothetical protein